MTDTEDWYVKYGTLSIYYANGDEKQVEWEYDPWESDDYKWGAGEYDIENADEHGVQYSEPMMKKRKTTMTPTNHLHTHGKIQLKHQPGRVFWATSALRHAWPSRGQTTGISLNVSTDLEYQNSALAEYTLLEDFLACAPPPLPSLTAAASL